MSGFLLDTNVISELTRPQPDARVISWLESTDEAQLHLSVLTLGEIRQGLRKLAAGQRRARLEDWLSEDLPRRFADRLLGIDAAVADRWGQISGDSRQRGAPLPVIDGLLAATAYQHRLTMATRNVQHFAALDIETLNPWGSAGSR